MRLRWLIWFAKVYFCIGQVCIVSYRVDCPKYGKMFAVVVFDCLPRNERVQILTIDTRIEHLIGMYASVCDTVKKTNI